MSPPPRTPSPDTPRAGLRTADGLSRAGQAMLGGSRTALRGERYSHTIDLKYIIYFVPASDPYGRAGRAFFEQHRGEHLKRAVRSFEELFNFLHADLPRQRDRALQRWSGSGPRPAPEATRVRIDELVILTHANAAGAMKIPLAHADIARQRYFTPWNLAELQHEMIDQNQHPRFRRRRAEVVRQAFDKNTHIVVRGCRIGQSEPALRALRIFFNGQPFTWGPIGWQGYDELGVGAGRRFADLSEAYAFMEQYDLIPYDHLTDEAPARPQAARDWLRRDHIVPAHFFVLEQSHYDALQALIGNGQGLLAAAEEHKDREGVNETGIDDTYWEVSNPREAALYTDPELEARITAAVGPSASSEARRAEIVRRARILRREDRPQNASMLLRLRDLYISEQARADRIEVNSDDPLGGMPDDGIFGDGNILAGQSDDYPEFIPRPDLFETQRLRFDAPADRQAAEQQYDSAPIEVNPDAAAASAGPDPLQHLRSTPAPPPPNGAEMHPLPRWRGGVVPGQPRPPRRSGPSRGFNKDEPAIPVTADTDTALYDAVDLANLADDALIERLLADLPPQLSNDPSWVDILSLTNDAVAGVITITGASELAAGIFLLEAGTVIVGPILMVISFGNALSDASDHQEFAAKALGVRLANEQVALDVLGDPPATRFDSATIARRLANHRDVLAQITYSYPIGPENCIRHIRIGIDAVVETANRASADVERNFRRRVAESNLPEEAKQQMIEHVLPRMRQEVLVRLFRNINQEIREAYEAARSRAER